MGEPSRKSLKLLAFCRKFDFAARLCDNAITPLDVAAQITSHLMGAGEYAHG